MLQYVIISFSLLFLNACSAYGTTLAIAEASVSAIPLCSRKNMIAKIYILVIMSASIFFYTFFLSLLIVFKITKEYLLVNAMKHSFGCVSIGVCAASVGKAMASVMKNGFLVLKKKPTFFTSFLLIVGFCEVVMIFMLILVFTNL